jgi:hypothetical protein
MERNSSNPGVEYSNRRDEALVIILLSHGPKTETEELHAPVSFPDGEKVEKSSGEINVAGVNVENEISL